MAKTKHKKKPVIPPKPSGLIREEVKKHIFHINDEITQIAKKYEDIDITMEAGSIGDTLDCIEDCFKELEEKFDETETKITELGTEAEDLKAEVERITEYSDGLTNVNTMVGELRYKTNNFLDADLLDLFTQCLAEVRPADLHTHLQTILKERNSSSISCSVDDIL